MDVLIEQQQQQHQQQQMMTMSSYVVDFDDDSWWEVFVTDDNNSTDNDTNIQLGFKTDQINQFYNQSSGKFFDEKMSKKDYFQICCFKYIMDTCCSNNGGGGGDESSQQAIIGRLQQFWNLLKQSYLNIKVHQNQSTINILQWILPDPSVMTVIINDNSNDETTKDSIVVVLGYLMTFWKQLYQAYDDDDNNDINTSAVNENQRPTKRRRLGRYREKNSGFTSLLKGQYKLPAVYLLICCVSLMKEQQQSSSASAASNDWKTLYKLAHQLPTSFKTFSEIDIQAGLALVGWNMFVKGETMEGFYVQSE